MDDYHSAPNIGERLSDVVSLTANYMAINMPKINETIDVASFNFT